MLLNKLFGKKNKSSSHKNSDHNDDDDGENVQISSPVQVINHNSSSQSSSTLMGKQQQQQLDFCTLAIHADRQVEKHVSDIAPPLHFSTTYDLDPELRSQHVYGRVHNATRERVEKVLAQLEGSDKFSAVTYASGQTATFSLFYHLRPKKVYINRSEGYSGTQDVLASFTSFIESYAKRAVRETFQSYFENEIENEKKQQQPQEQPQEQEQQKEEAEHTNDEVASSKNDHQSNNDVEEKPKKDITIPNMSEPVIQILDLSTLLSDHNNPNDTTEDNGNGGNETTKAFLYSGTVIWLETPRNPRCLLEDISLYARIAKRIGALVVVDSTFASPALQQPLLLGADYVLHSCTKFMGGHSDLLAATVVTRNDTMGRRLRSERSTFGQNMGNMEAWLLLRSLKTLDLRVKQQSRTATELAQWFEGQIDSEETGKHVTKVWYPLLQKSHPEHYELCQRQMGGHGPGILSIELDSPLHARLLPSRLNLVFSATSLGGVESLIDYRYQWDMDESPTLLRISVGLESSRDLINDFRQALLSLNSLHNSNNAVKSLSI